MGDKIRTALIGCGKVSDFHAKALSSLYESEFVAVCNRNLNRTEEFVRKYSVKAYDSIENMIHDAKVEAVFITTPHPNHAKAAVTAIKNNVHVMVEKPLAVTLEDCDIILNEAKKANVKVGVISQRRFYAPCQRIKKALDEGKLGKPIIGQVTILGWRDMAYYQSDPWRGKWKEEGGGVLVNQAPHQLDLLLWYMGEIDYLYGIYDTLNHPELEVEDTAVAAIKFKNGGLGSILVSNSQNPALYGKVHIHGENGASVGVQTDGGSMFIAGVSSIAEPPFNDIWTISGEENMLDIWKKEDSEFFSSIDYMHYYHKKQIEDFLMCIKSGNEPLVTGIDGRRTVELFMAIYRSHRNKKPIKFPL